MQRLREDDLMTSRHHRAATAKERLQGDSLMTSRRHRAATAEQTQHAQPETTTTAIEVTEADAGDMDDAQQVADDHDASEAQQIPLPTQHAPDTAVVATTTAVPVAIWEIIIDQLLAYKPGNEWALSKNPTVHSLEGDTAQSFLKCRATCTAFDHHMLRQFSQFTMRLIRHRRDPVLFEVEFEQREFQVCGTPNGTLYSEFRKYSPELLRLCRDLIRTNDVHDKKERLPRGSPEVQFWVSLDIASRALGPGGEPPSPCLLARQSAPWFLSLNDRDALHEQRLRAAWTPEQYEAFLNEQNERSADSA